MANVVFRLDADTAKAVQGFLKVVDAQRKTEAGQKKITQASREAHTANQQMIGSLRGVVSALGIGGGIAGAVMLIRDTWMEIDRYLERVAQKSRQAAQDMTAFVLMQAGGTRAERVAEAGAIGARWGVFPGEAFGQLQRLQAMPQVRTYERALKAAEAVWRLQKWAAVPQEAATTAVTLAMGMGYTAAQAARLPYAAGEASQLSPAELAEAAQRGLPPYGGIEGMALTGYQVMAAMSGTITEPSMLGTYAARVAETVMTGKGETGRLWRRLGVEKAGFWERLEALSKAGITTMQELERAGITEKRARMGIYLLVRDWEATLTTRRAVRELYEQAGLIARKRAEAEAEVPQMRLAREMDVLQAIYEEEQVTGPEAIRAMKREVERRRFAIWARRRGWGWVTTEEGGLTIRGKLWKGIQEQFIMPFWTREQYRRYEEEMGELTGVVPRPPEVPTRTVIQDNSVNINYHVRSQREMDEGRPLLVGPDGVQR